MRPIVQILAISLITFSAFAEQLSMFSNGDDLNITFIGSAPSGEVKPGEWQGIYVCASDYNGSIRMDKRRIETSYRVIVHRGWRGNFKALPAPGYEFSYWEINDKKVDGKLLVEFDGRSNISVTAVMKQIAVASN